jgi:hypothetical protein
MPRTDLFLTLAQAAQTTLGMATNNEPNINIRVQDDAGNWSAASTDPWAPFSVNIQGAQPEPTSEGPWLYDKGPGKLSHLDCNLNINATPAGGDVSRVEKTWVNNLDSSIFIKLAATTLGVEMAHGAPGPAQYLLGVQRVKQGTTDRETIYAWGPQTYTSSGVPTWGGQQTFPDPGFEIEVGDMVVFVGEGFTTNSTTFNFQIDTQMFYAR